MDKSPTSRFIKAKVKTGEKRDRLESVGENAFKISVRAEAKQNQANDRACELIAAHFKIPLSRVRLVSGHHRPSKLFSVKIRL